MSLTNLAASVLALPLVFLAAKGIIASTQVERDNRRFRRRPR